MAEATPDVMALLSDPSPTQNTVHQFKARFTVKRLGAAVGYVSPFI